MTEPLLHCTQCGEEKPHTDFYHDARKTTGRYSACIECTRKARRENYWSDIDSSRERGRQAFAQFYMTNRERALAHARRWQAANPEKVREIDQRRSARLRGAKVDVVSFEAILERDGLICHICSGEVDPLDVHFDHVIPLSRGGAHSEDNIKVAHSFCNLSKGAKLLEELSHA